MLENIIAYYCGPALAGIKPSNIVSCLKNNVTNIYNKIDELNIQLNKKDIYIEIISEYKDRVLLMVYRKKQLVEYLSKKDIKNFLHSFGYPYELCVNTYIAFLKKRLKQYKEFPHEIGAFLGYPLHDIEGFINHKNEGYLFVGEWKVYKNEQSARQLFERYNKCRKALLKRIYAGNTLAQIFCVA